MQNYSIQPFMQAVNFAISRRSRRTQLTVLNHATPLDIGHRRPLPLVQ